MNRSDRAPLEAAVHLTPRRGWMNDPNGLCHVDGRWHAFYQHDPYSDRHGPMHWGHASTTDLTTWTYHPIALEPDDLGVAFSGSVVIDHDDTAGFGADSMIAIFTHHRDDVGRIRERQSLAVSRDRGTTWSKFGANPVLDTGQADARDPHVVRVLLDDGSPIWLMTLAVGTRLAFFRSTNLRDWSPVGTFEDDRVGGTTWECPTLVRFGSGADAAEWMLSFSTAAGPPAGHGGTVGFFGQVSSAGFVATTPPFALDGGPDFYAAQVFANAPGGPTMMAWLGSWRYATIQPSCGRRGVMSIARRLAVEGTGARRTLVARPVIGHRVRRGRPVERGRWSCRPGHALVVDGRGSLLVEVATADRPVATIRLDEGIAELVRHDDPITRLPQRFTVPRGAEDRHIVVLDHGTVEAFVDGGRTTLSALVFAGANWTVRVNGDADLVEI